MHEKQYLEKSNAVVEKFKVIGAEIQVSLLLDIPFRDSSVSFKIYGNIDRVDEVIDSSGNVRYRIIDYKTGKKKEKSNYSLDSFLLNHLTIRIMHFKFCVLIDMVYTRYANQSNYTSN